MVILSLLCRFLAGSGSSTVPADLALFASLAVVLTGVIGSRVLGERRATTRRAEAPEV
jgi:hypothetical protein